MLRARADLMESNEGIPPPITSASHGMEALTAFETVGHLHPHSSTAGIGDPMLSLDSSRSLRPRVSSNQELVEQRLLPYAIFGGSEFANPYSYNYKALRRLALESSVLSFTDAKLVQYYALYCIYEATNSNPNLLTIADPRFEVFDGSPFPTWRREDGWKDVNTEACGSIKTDGAISHGWYGITCKTLAINGVETRVVTELNLVNNAMTGAFPPEVALLAGPGGDQHVPGAGQLEFLDLSNNPFLFNNFDTTWITKMGSDFEFLYLRETGFAGTFPVLPSGLLEADFAHTLIRQGFNEEAFADARSLEYLNMAGQFLNTTLPRSLVTLPNLRFLYLSFCHIRGDLSYLHKMPAIYEHWIDGNPELKGPIPTEIGGMSTLAALSITESAVSGSIPSEVGKLTNLRRLWLYGNRLTGTIPTHVGNLRSLETLEVTSNSLTGEMPEEICDLKGIIRKLKNLGSDCNTINCACCSCCGLSDCHPQLFPQTQ